jgi:hypothetical protein
MPTPEQCKKKLFNLGVKLGVSPRLISTRLLSVEDKKDMLQGLISDDELECHVLVWKERGMYSYADGSNLRYTSPKELPMRRYRGNGKNS